MSSIFSIIRIAAVVGLSAIKVVSTCLKFKEAKEQGLINPVFMRTNNSTPATNPMMNNMTANGSMNMNQCNYSTEPIWHDCTNTNYVNSRRNMVNTTTSMMYNQPMQNNMFTSYPQQPTTSCAYSNNMVNNYQPYNDPTSRRWNSNPYVNMYQYQPQPVQQYPQYQPRYQQYPQYQYQQQRPYNEQTWSNKTYGELEEEYRRRQGLTGMWQNNRPQQYPQYQNMRGVQQQRPYNEQTWSNKTYGELEEEMRQYNECVRRMNQSRRANMRYGNLNQAFMKNIPRDNRSGVVPMFYTDDGVPLFGPVPA